MTKTSKHINNNINWNTYPRPQLKRPQYSILNGVWKLNGKDIIVPFPPQSELSGYKSLVTDNMVYETCFEVPQHFDKERILLNFGAVDQIAEVWLNGKHIGTHKGGYLPFTYDITDIVDKQQPNNLEVRVTDELSKDYPYGKQCKNRGGMWYTPVSGIWQTVWLENVPTKFKSLL